MRASFIQGIIRPGFDFVIDPLTRANNTNPPPIVKRKVKWLLGAVVGTYDINERNGTLEKTLMTGAIDVESINIAFKYNAEDCWFGKERLDDVLWRPCDESSKVSRNILTL